MELGIKDIQIYLPEATLSNAELINAYGFDKKFLNNKIGISKRHISRVDESISDMAVQAIQRLVEKNNDLTIPEIDMLVLCTQNPDYRIPHSASLIQDKLSFGSIASFDVNLACSGFVYGLAIITSLMKLQNSINGLLITSDAYSKVINKEDCNTISLFGDGATATWISRDYICSAGKYSLGTDGSGYNNLYIKEGGSRYPLDVSKDGSKSDIGKIRMDGREIFNFVLRRITKDTQNCLNINGLRLEDIDYFVFHQANMFILEKLSKKIGIDPEKMVYWMADTGNTVSSSIPMVLRHLMITRKLKDKIVLISGFGAGLSWGSTILRFQGE